MQLHDAFERFAKRDMTDRDYTAWLSVRAIGEAATRSGKTDVNALRDYLLSDGHELPLLAPSVPPADPDRGTSRRGLDLAAGRVPAPEIPH
jgi:hypothetical protein